MKKVTFMGFSTIIILFLLIVFLINGCAKRITSGNGCDSIRREAVLCDFFVSTSKQKEKCLNKLKKRFGTRLFNRCTGR